MWYDFLAAYRPRFQRQKVIDNFVADFYCHKAKLIIEIDGMEHYTESGMKKDEFRTEKLENYGLTVIRLTNRQVDIQFEESCTYIDNIVKDSLSQLR